METNIQIQPSRQLFTGNLVDGRAYLLGTTKHATTQVYWTDLQFKQLIDSMINDGTLQNAALSQEEISALMFLAGNQLVHFSINSEPLSKVVPDSRPDAVRNNQREAAKQLDTVLYKTNSPFSVKLELTTSCNLRCRYCYMHGAKNASVNSKRWIRVLERLRQLGAVRLELTGGEPLLYDSLVEIVHAVDRMGFDTTICTNGVLIDRTLVELIKRARSVDLRISFHSADRDTFEHFVRVHGSYSKVVKALNMLLDADASVSALVVLTTINEITIYDTIAYLEDAGIDFDVSAFVFPRLFTTSDNREYRPSAQSVDSLVKLKYLSPRKSKCSALRTKLWISCNGDVFPCEMYRHIKIANILETDLEEIWTSKPANHFRNHVSQTLTDCDACEHSSYCGYCPALCQRYSGKPIRWLQPADS